jgi:L-lactate dehydrogenase complex protein LldG
MDIRDPRKAIIDKLRVAKDHQNNRSKLQIPQPVIDYNGVFEEPDDIPEVVFARNLVQVNGKFAFCQDEKELILALRVLVHEEKWQSIFCIEPAIRLILDRSGISCRSDPEALLTADASITGCEYLVARTGSVLVSSRQGSGRRVFAYSPVHVVLGKTSQLVDEIHEALAGIREKYSHVPSQISMITGPSRTADIEKTLVLGAHGPRQLYVFLYQEDTKPPKSSDQ